ncbi:uncharacterized protein LOC122041364 isoform X2 [Zingiber officinale]|uniref:uncharacterized protein LOC122041364 isoform X2 n=1 Tax=Zingiber officinale TaxID=94328 RepID=UPI001C4B6EB5|nr:uncharacterized protein LOC122041364 isoform X2 [Zingiber officinale]
MAARSSRLLSSLRRSNGGAKATSTALPSLQRSLFSGSPTPGVSYWLPRSRSKWRILPTSPNRPPPPFEFVKRRIVALGRCFGKKSLSSSVFGLAFVSAMINRQASTLHAFDDFIDDEVELAAPSGQPKDKLHPFYTILFSCLVHGQTLCQFICFSSSYIREIIKILYGRDQSMDTRTSRWKITRFCVMRRSN